MAGFGTQNSRSIRCHSGSAQYGDDTEYRRGIISTLNYLLPKSKGPHLIKRGPLDYALLFIGT